MAIGSGLAASHGVAAETVYGTYTAPTRWFEVTKAEMKKSKATVQGGGLAAGRFAQLASRRVQISEAGSASIEQEVTKKGMGLLLSHIFGAGGTPAVQGASTAYLQAHTLGDNVGKSLTIQNGVPDVNGTVRPRTGTGGKVTKASFSCDTSGLLMLGLEVDFQKVSKAQTLAAPSYATALAPFHGGELRVKMGAFGAEVAVAGVRGFTLDIERPHDTERKNTSTVNPTVKDQPLMNDWVKVSGTLQCEFQNETDFEDRFAADTSTSLVIENIGAIIALTYPETFRLKCPAVFFEDTIAVVSGPGLVVGSVPFTAQLDLANGLVACDYQSSDSTL